MQPRKLNVAIGRFPYGGNGGTSQEVPDITDWLLQTVVKMKSDPRVDRIFNWRKSDTPITMVRNDCVDEVLKMGADALVMIDSDMRPDNETMLGDPLAKPFWDTSFDFLYAHYDRGPCVVGAPYCGPPPHEVPYIFHWANQQSDHRDVDHHLEMYTREHAAIMGGISEVGALPTGLILFDLRIFKVVPQPWFYYEYSQDGMPCRMCGLRRQGPQTRKDSTEDVTFTRDSSLIAIEKLGYNPLYCNWDAWAGHWKPKCVGKPRLATADAVGAKYREAILSNRRSDMQMVNVGSDPRSQAALQRLRGNGVVGVVPAKKE